MSRFHSNLRALIAAAVALGCFQTQARAATSVPSGIPPAVLGTGIEASVFGVRGDCITGQIVYEGEATSKLLTDEPIDIAAIDGRLNGPPATDSNPLALLQGVRSRFVERAKPSETSVSVVYGYEIGGRWAGLSGISPTRIGTTQLAATPATRRAACGNGALARAELGGAVYAALRFDFSSKAVKEQFTKDIDLPKASFGNLTGKLRRAGAQFETGVSITLSAFQVGGDPSLLSHIFGDGGGTLPVFRCSVQNLQGCADAADQMRQYIVDPQAGFRSQFGDFTIDPSRRGGPAVLRYEAKTYDELGVPAFATPALDASFVAPAEAQRKVAGEALKTRARIANRAASIDFFDAEDDPVLQALNARQQRLLYVLSACTSSPSRCVAAVDDTLATGVVP